MRDDGGPAFPTEPKNHGYAGSEGTGSNPGMTLSDYFAAKAMQGWMATYPSDQAYAGVSADEVACLAYRIADAMLKARSL